MALTSHQLRQAPQTGRLGLGRIHSVEAVSTEIPKLTRYPEKCSTRSRECCGPRAIPARLGPRRLSIPLISRTQIPAARLRSRPSGFEEGGARPVVAGACPEFAAPRHSHGADIHVPTTPDGMTSQIGTYPRRFLLPEPPRTVVPHDDRPEAFNVRREGAGRVHDALVALRHHHRQWIQLRQGSVRGESHDGA